MVAWQVFGVREMVCEARRVGSVYKHTHTHTHLCGHFWTYAYLYTHTHVYIHTRIYLTILGRTALPFVSLSTDFFEEVASTKVDSLSFMYILIV